MARILSAEEVKALANEPGFGRAQAVVKAAGYWDEHAAPDGKKRKYAVRIVGEISVSATVNVEARSQEEAGELALEKANDPEECHKISWDYGDIYAVDFEGEDTKIIGECEDD